MENKMTVLVVDDEELLRNAIVFQFKREGFNVLSASNGIEAFEIIKSQKVDAVVSDIQMPGGNGIDLLKEVKSYDAEIPVMVFITAFADITEAEAYDLGANAIFSKPFDRKLLVKCIKDSIFSKGRTWKQENPHPKPALRLETKETAIVGRGGAMVSSSSFSPKCGETFTFEIPADVGGKILPLKGVGLVRWTEGEQMGMEFVSLDKENLEPFEKWLDENRIKPFIPKKAA